MKSTGKFHRRASLDKGWVIANHILVSFHVAFISSVLSIPRIIGDRGEVLKYMFRSPETIISCVFWYLTFHVGIAVHEMGHYLKAVRINALNDVLLPDAQARMSKNAIMRGTWYFRMFLTIPWGRFKGIVKTGLDYHPDSPYNLAVSAAGPAFSRRLAAFSLPLSGILLVMGLIGDHGTVVYIGRLMLGLGLVGLFDFLFADPGKYREFKMREKTAKEQAVTVSKTLEQEEERWSTQVGKVKALLVHTRMQELTLPDSNTISVPWEYRNCGMGGRHTEKEFPESNISMQESMFMPLSAENYEEAQEVTVKLQTRLKEIIENAEGCSVKGIGTEGGIAAYIKKGESDTLPVQRLWRMQKQAIIDCGYMPGKDVVMAIDPAASELQNAYRATTGLTDAKGMYLAWRDKEQRVLSRDDILEIYRKAIEEDDLPLVSIEDGFAEDDDAGWKLLMDRMGDKVVVVGDDNVTTKDVSIEYGADEGLINAALIKLNQIGTVTEGILAMLTAIGKKLELVISHRSKSPIEDFEAQVALASRALGLKCGGGSNSERVHKYEAVIRIIREALQEKEGTHRKDAESLAERFVDELTITEIVAREASTNTGIPTVGVEVKAGVLGSHLYEKLLVFEGATPLGTSAGTGEAIHLIDSIIEKSPAVEKHPELFDVLPDKTYRFRNEIKENDIVRKNDEELAELWRRSNRYNGKGCLNAVDYVNMILAKAFVGKKVTELGNLVDIDRKLLEMEFETAMKRNKISPHASEEEKIAVMQRKGNIGMNAILSLSLALARLKGAMQGKWLWEVIREQMCEAMAKTIADNGSMKIIETLPERLIVSETEKKKIENKGLLTDEDKAEIEAYVASLINDLEKQSERSQNELWKVLKDRLPFNGLCLGLQIVNETKQKDIPLFRLLREQVPVYSV